MLGEIQSFEHKISTSAFCWDFSLVGLWVGLVLFPVKEIILKPKKSSLSLSLLVEK